MLSKLRLLVVLCKASAKRSFFHEGWELYLPMDKRWELRGQLNITFIKQNVVVGSLESIISLAIDSLLGLKYQIWISFYWAGLKANRRAVAYPQDNSAIITPLHISYSYCSLQYLSLSRTVDIFSSLEASTFWHYDS